MERLNAAKKYWDKNDYDAVVGEYYDPEKEQKFKTDRELEQKDHGKHWIDKLPQTWKDEGALYNPINGVIEDEHRLHEKDLKDKNKRKRFELRYDIERQMHKESL